MEVRLIQKGEGELCNEFYNRIHRKKRRPNQWEWEFTLNTYSHHSNVPPFAVAADKGNIVGTQAFIPIQMIDSGGVFWTAKSEETLVDPNYRGKQLFEKMYHLLFEIAKEHGFRYIWGFTPAVKAFDRLGFEVPGKTEQLFYPFSVRCIPALLEKDEPSKAENSSSLRILAMKAACLAARGVSEFKRCLSSNPHLADVRLETMPSCDEQTGDVCRRFINQWGGVTIYRDKQYLTWRVFNNPYNRCIMRAAYRDSTLLGWVAFTLGDDGMGYLVDILVAPELGEKREAEDITRMLLRETVAGCRRMGATAIRGWHVTAHPFDLLVAKVARNMGFFSIKRGHAVVISDQREHKDDAIRTRFSEWYVTRIFTEGVFG